jgi:hypothetical protein
MSGARHRAAGFGRYIAFTPARPRHAVPGNDHQARRDLLVGGAVAVVLTTGGVGLGAVAAKIQSSGGPRATAVALPTTAAPAPATVLTLGERSAVRQAAKVRPPVYLGPLGAAQLTTFCHAHAGLDTTAVSTDDGWVCGPGTTTLGMNAVCRWWHGDAAWAGMTDDNDPTTWRCYRDPQ